MNDDVRRPATALLAALALAAPLALSGCSFGDMGGGNDGGPIPVDPGPGGEVPDDDARDCLVGSWTVSQRELQSYYAALGASRNLDVAIEGDIAIAFSETTYIYEPDVDFTLALPNGQNGTAELDGTVSGDYTQADGLITTENDVNRLELESEVNGAPVDLTDSLRSFIDEHPINDIAYSCTDAGPLMEWKTADGVHAVQLTAR